MKRETIHRAACVIASVVTTNALGAERYDLVFTDARYSGVDQSQLSYSSFVGDRETGAIYSCTGKVILRQKTGTIMSHTESCMDAYAPPSGSRGEYTFGRLSTLDASGSPNKPRMSPAWGFWRIDQTKRLHAFCLRYGSPTVVWTCFETPLPPD